MKINAIYLFSQNQYDLDLTHFIANQLETPVRSPSLETSFSKDEDFLGALWFIDANSTNFLKFFLNSVEKLKIGKGSIYFFADRKKSLRQIQEIKNKVHYGNVIFRSSDPIEKSAKKVFALSCFPENRPHFLFPENGRNSLQKKWSVKNF